MWGLTETVIASIRKRVSKEKVADIRDPIQTSEEKYKRKCSIVLFVCLCLFGFASYIFSFQSLNLGMVPIAEKSIRRTIEILEERRTHLNKACTNLQLRPPKTPLNRFYVDKSNNLMYCKVPKCGCTYWTRFFQALKNKNSQKDPFNTSRFKTHRTNLRKTSKVSINSNNTTRFLVTRDPYSRLYSAYVDKLFLPEFWTVFGRNIVKHIRKNATNLAKLCGNDVTFAEFLKMISLRDHLNMNWKNSHWLPIEKLCHPCTFKYNFIIKQETFARDRDYLIRKLGIKEKSILNYNNISHLDYSLSAIKDLCDTFFMHLRKRKPNACYKREVLFQKLFVSFQIQGYIREDARFDMSRFGDLNPRNIRRVASEVFQNIYREHPVLTRHDWKEQRNRFRKNAYKLVDTEILEGIKKCYDLDFKIFNYDPEPEEIFGNRKNN